MKCILLRSIRRPREYQRTNRLIPHALFHTQFLTFDAEFDFYRTVVILPLCRKQLSLLCVVSFFIVHLTDCDLIPFLVFLRRKAIGILIEYRTSFCKLCRLIPSKIDNPLNNSKKNIPKSPWGKPNRQESLRLPNG